jgi:hypothetical protein
MGFISGPPGVVGLFFFNELISCDYDYMRTHVKGLDEERENLDQSETSGAVEVTDGDILETHIEKGGDGGDLSGTQKEPHQEEDHHNRQQPEPLVVLKEDPILSEDMPFAHVPTSGKLSPLRITCR